MPDANIIESFREGLQYVCQCGGDDACPCNGCGCGGMHVNDCGCNGSGHDVAGESCPCGNNCSC